ncbi:J domain-containing protein [Pseudenhygromyxa sp. WMMC2535]|uniref:J domain-containing protein n=1 Tax=Pseudenhygromyxa sp. WMMC2535 TaxID=2712867 RepID=UPI0015560D50|nr:J domain-containing protein [Pseudenhygromyxa sp. WMMC2535]NVB36342.1 J domain-containing protein [Pseudenhygromyxa sp. WMMC2535]
MSPDEARAILDVDAHTDARTLKRAYLRKIKKAKPERDPEGFQRLRAAYELLESWREDSEWDARDEWDEPSALSRSGETNADFLAALPSSAAPSANEAPILDPPLPQAEAPPSPRDQLWTLVEAIDATLETALETGTFAATWALIDEALDLAEFEAAPAPPAALIFEITTAALMHASDPEPACQAFSRWSRLTTDLDPSSAALEDEERACLLLLAELVEFVDKSPGCPPPFYALIASALHERDPDARRVELSELAEARPSAARKTRAQLHHHAPSLAAIYSASLGETTDPQLGGERAQFMRKFLQILLKAGVVILIIGLHFCS